MKSPAWYLVLFVVLFGPLERPARAEITPEAVREAIDRGVGYLKRQQLASGGWPEYMTQPCGASALITLALLSAGVPATDPMIKNALDYLRKFDANDRNSAKTYSIALQTMVFCRAEPTNHLLIGRNVRWLEKTQNINQEPRGSWSYPGVAGDNSNSQFAVLALYEAERVGIPVNRQTWRLAEAYWKDCQNPDGSWGYHKGLPGTGSMTAAGIACLVVTSDRIGPADATVEGGQIKGCQQADIENDRVQRALQWLGKRFSVRNNPGSRGTVWLLYYLYGMERVGRLTAQRFINGHDWYREGSEFLLELKKGPLSDHWGGLSPSGIGRFVEYDERVSTAFAILFLAKGRWPVLVSKVKYGSGNDWNQHRNDIGNLTHYVESRWQKDLVWQVLEIDAASVDDLVQSPVLYFCGSNSPLPDDLEKQQELAHKLRDYLDRGGFIFAESYCGGAGFNEGFRKLVKLIFPEPEYQLKTLPPGHPIWQMEEPVDVNQTRLLLGVEYGCRTSVVYCPQDTSDKLLPSLSAVWELSRPGRQEEESYNKEVKAQIHAGQTIGLNVMAYATNREFKGKEEYFTTPDVRSKSDEIRRGKLLIANLRHPGGCNAAPRAITNLLLSADKNLRLRVNTDPREIAISDPALFDYHMVFMHGRNAFRLTDAERKQLKTYVQRGGLVFADAICAEKSFTESFRQEMQKIFPETPLKEIPKEDTLFTPTYGGSDITTVTRRDPQERSRSEPLKALLRKVAPELEGIKIGDRYGVIFSKYDLSCALEKQDSVQCQGYVRDDAARIGLNVILYSLQQ